MAVDAMESADFSARTDDGRRYILDRSRADETQLCIVWMVILPCLICQLYFRGNVMKELRSC